MLIHAWATYLKYFCDVVSFKSFSKAADRNFISQSAVSQAVKKLEEMSGHELIYHSRNSFQLTPEGQLLYHKAQGLLQECNALADFFSQLKKEKWIKIHFGCMHSIALALVPTVLKEFKKRHPQAEISFELGHGTQMLERVANGEIDFALAIDNEDLEAFHTIKLYAGLHQVYERKGASSKKFLFSDASYEAKEFSKKYRSHYGKPPEIEIRVASWEVIASLTKAGIGRGYFPDYLTLHHQGLLPVDFPFSPLPYKIVAVFKSKRHVSRYAEQFLKTADKLFESHVFRLRKRSVKKSKS